jgi:hypothetical protein
MSLPDINEFENYDTIEVYESHSHKIHKGFLDFYISNKHTHEEWDKISRVQLLVNGTRSSEMRNKIISKFPYDTIEIRSTRLVLFEKNIIEKHYQKGQDIIKHLKES